MIGIDQGPDVGTMDGMQARGVSVSEIDWDPDMGTLDGIQTRRVSVIEIDWHPLMWGPYKFPEFAILPVSRASQIHQ